MKYLILVAILYLVYRFYVRSRSPLNQGPADDTQYIDYEEIEEDDKE